MKNKVKDVWLGSNHNPVIFCLLEGISLKCKHIVVHLYWSKNPLAMLGLTVDYKLNTNVYERVSDKGVSVSIYYYLDHESNLLCSEANTTFLLWHKVLPLELAIRAVYSTMESMVLNSY